MLKDDYIDYIRNVRRYSERTISIYEDSLREFARYLSSEDENINDEELKEALSGNIIRSYELHLMDTRALDPKTVGLHISVLSGFCRFLVGRGILESNPAKAVARPKTEKRLPSFYRKGSMEEYFGATEYFGSEEAIEDLTQVMKQEGKDAERLCAKLWDRILGRLIVSILYTTGIRRSELISLRQKSFDFSRMTLLVTGKGDKMREIPITDSLYKEISLYLKAVKLIEGRCNRGEGQLLRTFQGNPIYPVYADRAIKRELGGTESIIGKKSPHVLRHSLATELLNKGADMYSIKELLGHSSLAATQVYTHNSIGKLKKVYSNAHPRAKRGGNNGD